LGGGEDEKGIFVVNIGDERWMIKGNNGC